jgi:hypothetical protein
MMGRNTVYDFFTGIFDEMEDAGCCMLYIGCGMLCLVEVMPA